MQGGWEAQKWNCGDACGGHTPRKCTQRSAQQCASLRRWSLPNCIRGPGPQIAGFCGDPSFGRREEGGRGCRQVGEESERQGRLGREEGEERKQPSRGEFPLGNRGNSPRGELGCGTLCGRSEVLPRQQACRQRAECGGMGDWASLAGAGT